MNNKAVAEKVVNRIIEMINENNSLPWVKPWNRKADLVKVVDGYKEITIYPNSWNHKGVEYKGVNTYLPSGEYITWNQCKAEGGSVKKGAKGFPVVYWNFVFKDVENDAGEKETIRIPVLKYYTVFRVEDCDGIKQKFNPGPRTVKVPLVHYEPKTGSSSDLNAAAEAIIADYTRRAGNGFHVDRDAVTDEAYYSPARDFVNVPRREQFGDVAEFYSTLFHELGHSTGHSSRLNRFTGAAANAAFGSQEYSKEELVAESTAATMLNALGLENGNSFRNSAAYIQSWSNHIKNDPLMFVSAMTKAQAAVDLILGLDADPGHNPGGVTPEAEPEEPKAEETKEEPKAEKQPEPKADKKTYSAVKRMIQAGMAFAGDRTSLAGWYDLEDNDNPATIIVGPYAAVVTGKFTLPEEFHKSDARHRNNFFRFFDNARFNARGDLPVPSVADLKELIASDNKARTAKERKKGPLCYDFGDDLPKVNARYLLDILTIIGTDSLTIRHNGKAKPIYLNNDGSEAVLCPVNKQ